MLYHNGERIDISIGAASKKRDFVKKFIQKQLDILGYQKQKDGVYPLKFKFNPKFGKVSIDQEGRPGPIEWPGPKAYINIRSIQAEEDFMSGTWMYSEQVPKKGKDDRLSPMPRYFKMQKVTYIPLQKKELIFWFMWVYASHFGNDFVLENKLGEAREEMRMEGLISDVRSIIVSTRVFKESQKRDMAALYGIAGAHRREIDLVMSELLSEIEVQEKKRGRDGTAYQEFLHKSRFDERINSEVFIRKCEDELVVVYERTEHAWYWGAVRGNLGTKITTVTNLEERYAELIDYIVAYPETKEKMEEKFKECSSEE